MPRFLAGMDVAYHSDTGFVAAVVWDAKRRVLLGKQHAVEKVSVKYIPGLLGFREGPLLCRIAGKLAPPPNVFLVDGQGFAHPRGFGLACHVGLAIDKPTVGVAKSPLYGKEKRDSIVDSDGKVIGRVVTASSGKKFYVSVGHRISLDTARRLVHDCIVEGHPFPLRQAHLDSIRMKEGLQV